MLLTGGPVLLRGFVVDHDAHVAGSLRLPEVRDKEAPRLHVDGDDAQGPVLPARAPGDARLVAEM